MTQTWREDFGSVRGINVGRKTSHQTKKRMSLSSAANDDLEGGAAGSLRRYSNKQNGDERRLQSISGLQPAG
jgi:hypothetical protein